MQDRRRTIFGRNMTKIVAIQYCLLLIIIIDEDFMNVFISLFWKIPESFDDLVFVPGGIERARPRGDRA